MRNPPEHIDVLVIGAGAGGLACARVLADSGLSVVVLEAGRQLERSEFPTAKQGWQREEAREAFSPFPKIRKDAMDFQVDATQSDIEPAWFAAVGGSTILFSGHYLRMRPADFELRTSDGESNLWPITFDEMTRHYEEVRRFVAVSGLEGDPAYPEVHDLLPPVPPGLLGERLARGFNELGWHWWPSYGAIATRSFRGHNPCQNLGPCNLGCPQGAKSSADIAFMWQAPENLTVLPDYHVTKILASGSAVSGVETQEVSGQSRVFFADRIVVAANAIGTPRLLLNSVSEDFPNGLANGSGMVGTHLMMHPLAYVEGVFSDTLQSHWGPQGCMLYSHEFYRKNASAGYSPSFTLQALRGPWPVEFASQRVLRGDLPMGNLHFERFLDTFDKTAHLAVIVEDYPEFANRVVLRGNEVDRFGLRAVSLEYAVSESAREVMKQGISAARRVLEAAGAVRTWGFGPVRKTGWHLMGTCRMGIDPKESVVDSFGRAHDLTNLYIADGSIMPSGGSVNPAATIQALAVRVANGILMELTGAR